MGHLGKLGPCFPRLGSGRRGRGEGGSRMNMAHAHQALQFKQEGNKLFGKKKYDSAVECYSKAIKLDPKVPQFYTNRALCYLKLQKWEKAVSDCRCALEMDLKSVKAYFFLGQALSELDSLDESCSCLQKAYQLTKELEMNVGDELANTLRQVKKKRWLKLEEKRMKQEIELEKYLVKLVEKDFAEKSNLSSQDAADTISPDHKELTPENLKKAKEERVNEVLNLFREIDDRRQKREVPDFLCCKISFELLEDPVVTPSGITYNRKELEEHLQRVGHFDPVTRVALTQDKLIPNLSMKEVVEDFIANNKWVDGY